MRCSTQLGVLPHEAKQKLGILYRANFIHALPGSRWSTTTLAKTILARLGVMDAVSHYFIQRQPLEPRDKTFLSLCLARERDDGAGDEIRTSLLKSATYFTREFSNALKEYDALRRYLYATVVGLTESAASLGAQNFYREMNQLWSDDAFHLMSKSTDTESGWKQQVAYCRRALDDVKKSNCYLSSSESLSERKSLVTKLVTWTRIMSTITSGKSDFQLRKLYQANPNRFVFVFHDMDKIQLRFADYAYRFLDSEGLVEESEKTANRVDLLQTKFKQVMETVEDLGRSTKLYDMVAPESGWGKTTSLMRSHSIISDIRKGHIALKRGELDSMNDDQVEELRKAIESFRLAIDVWMGQRAAADGGRSKH